MRNLVEEELRLLNNQKVKMMAHLYHLKQEFNSRVQKIEEASAKIDELQERVINAVDSFKMQTERSAKRELRRALADIDVLQKKLNEQETTSTGVDELTYKKAKTLGIFEAILFQLYNWSIHGDTASDFEMISQAVLFPSVYERVMDGKLQAYFLDKVPDSALDVVNMGREWIRKQRKDNDTSLSSPSVWKEHIDEISRWWLDVALPLLYDGERDPAWAYDEPFSQQEMIAWTDFPANRPLAFPKIFDGMTILQKYADEYRDDSGITEFTREAMELRLDPL